MHGTAEMHATKIASPPAAPTKPQSEMALTLAFPLSFALNPSGGQMNPHAYTIANPPAGSSPVRYHRGESFTIYGPDVQTHYAEVR